MRKKNRKKQAKMVTGLLIGGVVGATVGWLTAPNSGRETLRKLRGNVVDVRKRTKTAEENVESQVRELAEEEGSKVEQVRKTAQRKGVAASQSWK